MPFGDGRGHADLAASARQLRTVKRSVLIAPEDDDCGTPYRRVVR